MRIRIAVIFILSSILAAQTHAAAVGEAYTVERATAKQFRIDPYFNYSGVRGLKHTQGAVIVQSVSWHDRMGMNLLMLVESPRTESPDQTGCSIRKCRDAELFAYHYTVEDHRATFVRRVYDFEKGCDVDLVVKFLTESMTITDLNENGIAEITILYAGTCTARTAPLWMKLIMLENNRKYALRGTTRGLWIDNIPPEGVDPDAGWGRMDVDKAFEPAPLLLKYAKKRWRNHVYVDFTE